MFGRARPPGKAGRDASSSNGLFSLIETDFPVAVKFEVTVSTNTLLRSIGAETKLRYAEFESSRNSSNLEGTNLSFYFVCFVNEPGFLS